MSDTQIVTRFAPSPTGYLHVGGARTALFNWLYARGRGGRFLLRIEDTDRARSTPEAKAAILKGLTWLGLDWDGDPISQFERKDRHAEVARQMLADGTAYKCFSTPEEIAEWREANPRQPFQSPWRDATDLPDAPHAIRLRAPRDGETVIDDAVQGKVRVGNDQLDDMIILRSDGTPTYMLAVVVDDHDMGVTHVIRGDDHLTNTFRQVQIYRAMGWDLPEFAHIPLIHGADGAKLSKRHGALGVDAYRDMGYLPEAVRNYLLRLGWGHGDDEIISTEQAIEWFDLGGIGRSPSRFDFAKLDNLNAHYMRLADDGRLTGLITPIIETRLGRTIGPSGRDLLTRAMPGLKQRAKTLVELAESAQFYVAARPIEVTGKAADLVAGDGAALLADLADELRPFDAWNSTDIETKVREFAENRGLKLGKVAQPLRAALSGSTISPPIFEVAELLGKTETLARIADVAQPR